MEKTTKNVENGKSNKLDPQDKAIHEWYRFVLSFPPHLVRDYLSRFNVKTDEWVLDPFCGTGTTIVECKKNGIPAVGLEANPVVQYLSNIKLKWAVDPDRLEAHAEQVANDALQTLEAEGISDDPLINNFRLDAALHPLRTVSEECQKLLIKDAISPLPLHKTLVLLDAIESNKEIEFYDHERTAMAKEAVYSISNLRFGPEVGVGKVKQDSFVVQTWLQAIRSMAEDLRIDQIKANINSPAFTVLSDSRQMELQSSNKFSAVITSPPYPNEKDYSRTTRLESIILGFLNSKENLREQKKTFLRSNTRSIYKQDDDDLWIQHNPRVMELSQEIERTRIRMEKDSGFERLYHVVVKQYFGGMAKHLHELKNYLRPGAHLAYVVGDQASFLRIMIRTGEILSSIGNELGYTPLGIDLFRTRFSTATKENLREEVVLFRWDP